MTPDAAVESRERTPSIENLAEESVTEPGRKESREKDPSARIKQSRTMAVGSGQKDDLRCSKRCLRKEIMVVRDATIRRKRFNRKWSIKSDRDTVFRS
jgi:hypothetical protein